MSQSTIQTTIQADDCTDDVPGAQRISAWIDAAAAVSGVASGEVTVRFVGVDEMIELNSKFRGSDTSTNVLSFEFEDPPGLEEGSGILGDIVVCAKVVHDEAKQFDLEPSDRFAHMIIHGFLHLVGFDHIKESDALEMEQTETRALVGLGFNDPWHESAQVSL